MPQPETSLANYSQENEQRQNNIIVNNDPLLTRTFDRKSINIIPFIQINNWIGLGTDKV